MAIKKSISQDLENIRITLFKKRQQFSEKIYHDMLGMDLLDFLKFSHENLKIFKADS